MKRLLLACSALAVVHAGPAAASVQTESPYAKGQVFSAALRYLRIDLSYDVVEKDPEAAYLLFRFSSEGRKTGLGSIQIVERREGVRVLVKLQDLPRYQEQMLSEGLLRKVESEYGEPTRRPDPPRDKTDEKKKDDKEPSQ